MIGYDDDTINRSPGLEPVKVNFNPPTSPALTSRRPPPESPQDSCRRRKKKKRVPPSQGDVVLLRYLAPNHPDIAQAAGQQTLCFGSDSESSASLDETVMEEGHSAPETKATRSPQSAKPDTNDDTPKPPRSSSGLPSLITWEASQHSPVKRNAHEENGPSHGSDYPSKRRNSPPPTGTSQDDNDSSRITDSGYYSNPSWEQQKHSEAVNGLLDLKNNASKLPARIAKNSIAESPDLQPHIITANQRSPKQKLPTFHTDSTVEHATPTSPTDDQQSLPGLDQVLKNMENSRRVSPHQRNRTSSYSSMSSVAGSSPTQVLNPFADSTGPTLKSYRYQPSKGSGLSLHDDISRLDYASNSPISPRQDRMNYPSPRRRASSLQGTASSHHRIRIPQSASSSASASATTPGSSTTTTEAGASSTQLTPTDANIDMSHGSTFGSMSQDVDPNAGPALYKCKHDGCTAPPFQTPYLLK
ncbi:MAG: hypothetical protein M1831_005054 [Alyxoria varia]|nr:MAG: hypothetical protein M1831_005054 [Alyxoria varia]